MKIEPEIAIHEKVVNEKRQRKQYQISNGRTRKNNRKNTNGRKTQTIFYVDDSVFPPIKLVKTIKHLHR